MGTGAPLVLGCEVLIIGLIAIIVVIIVSVLMCFFCLCLTLVYHCVLCWVQG